MSNWTPKIGDEYAIPEVCYGYPTYEIYEWRNSIRDNARCETGIVCKCGKEAIKLAEKMLAVAKERMESKCDSNA